MFSCAIGKNFIGTEKIVRIIHGKRAIRVRAIEVILYNENLQIKNSDIFHISAQNIDCGYSLEPHQQGSSNEYPQSMFFSRNKKNNVYPCKPQFYYIKFGFKGSKLNRHVFVVRIFTAAKREKMFTSASSSVLKILEFS